MQWDKEKVVSTPRESQACLGRWATLCTLEPPNYTQHSYSRNTIFPSPWHRSRASSRNNSWSSKNHSVWWGNFHRSTLGRYRCTRWGKRCSTSQSYSISANLWNYHSIQVRPRSFVVGDLVLWLKQDGHGKLESSWVGPYIVTEVIPRGAYRLQDKNKGKTRVTRGMQSNCDGSTHWRHKATKSLSSLWPSEPRTWGHRSGSLGQLDNMLFYFPLGGSDPRVVRNNINKLLRFAIIWDILLGCSQPNIRQQYARFKGTR
jgi:hypothetical protein